jgi:hypothetical protein
MTAKVKSRAKVKATENTTLITVVFTYNDREFTINESQLAAYASDSDVMDEIDLRDIDLQEALFDWIDDKKLVNSVAIDRLSKMDSDKFAKHFKLGPRIPSDPSQWTVLKTDVTPAEKATVPPASAVNFPLTRLIKQSQFGRRSFRFEGTEIPAKLLAHRRDHKVIGGTLYVYVSGHGFVRCTAEQAEAYQKARVTLEARLVKIRLLHYESNIKYYSRRSDSAVRLVKKADKQVLSFSKKLAQFKAKHVKES